MVMHDKQGILELTLKLTGIHSALEADGENEAADAIVAWLKDIPILPTISKISYAFSWKKGDWNRGSCYCSAIMTWSIQMSVDILRNLFGIRKSIPYVLGDIHVFNESYISTI